MRNLMKTELYKLKKDMTVWKIWSLIWSDTKIQFDYSKNVRRYAIMLACIKLFLLEYRRKAKTP